MRRLAQAEAAARDASEAARRAGELAKAHQDQTVEVAAAAAQRVVLESSVEALTHAHQTELTSRRDAEMRATAAEHAATTVAEEAASELAISHHLPERMHPAPS